MLALGGKLHTGRPTADACDRGSSRPGRERLERSPGRLAKVLRRCVHQGHDLRQHAVRRGPGATRLRRSA